MNNTIDFNTAKTIGTMSKKIDHIDDTVSSFFSFMHMVMQNELGNAEPYFAATSPVLDLTVIRPDDAPHILPCFDEADEGINNFMGLTSEWEMKQIEEALLRSLGINK